MGGEQGDWSDKNTRSWSSSHAWTALETPQVPQIKDARQQMPPMEDLAQFEPEATADEVRSFTWTCKEEFFELIKRPGGFNALLEAQLDPYELWKKLKPAADSKPAMLLAKP